MTRDRKAEIILRIVSCTSKIQAILLNLVVLIQII